MKGAKQLPPRRLLALWLLGVLVTVAAGCQSRDPHDTVMAELPKLDPESFSPEIRARLQDRLRRAQSNPRDAGASGELGMLLHAHKRHDAAILCYRRARQLDQRSFRWRYLLGVALSKTGRLREAIDALRNAVDLRPEHVPAKLLLAESLLTLGQAHESKKIYQEVLREGPNLAAAHYGLGRVQSSEGKTLDAIESYRTACELDPKAGAAHYALAMAYRSAGESAKADSHTRIHQASNRGMPQIVDPLIDEVGKLGRDQHWFLNEGRRLDAEGRRDEAIKSYEEALAISPDFAQAHVNLLGAYGMLGNSQKAEYHYRRALERNASVPELHYNWGLVLAGLNRQADAAAAFRRALDLNPQFADAHQNLGTALEQMGQEEQAPKHYREALRHDPNHHVAHFHLGRYLVSKGRVDEGIAHLQRALGREDVRSPHVHYALSAGYLRAGRIEKAVEHARLARQLAEKYGQRDFAASVEGDLNAMKELLRAQ